MSERIMLRFPALNKPDTTAPTPGTLNTFSTKNLSKLLTLLSCRYIFRSANSFVFNKLIPSPETHKASKIGARVWNFPTQSLPATGSPSCRKFIHKSYSQLMRKDEDLFQFSISVIQIIYPTWVGIMNDNQIKFCQTKLRC